MEWVPKTKLGRLVSEGKITTMHDALQSRLPLREPEIVDILLPDLEDVVLNVNMVQRMTDSGRRVKFSVVVAVGNGDGYVGLGTAKGQEVGPTIRKAIDVAKLNIIEIKRGCGSWECGCGKPHTLPFAVRGKSGSVEVYLKPAPRGINLAVGNIAKSILSLAGIQDAWGFARGHTKTPVNYAYAVFDALKETIRVRVPEEMARKLHIHLGPAGMPSAEVVYTEYEDLEEEAKKLYEPIETGEMGAGSAQPAGESVADSPEETAGGEGEKTGETEAKVQEKSEGGAGK